MLLSSRIAIEMATWIALLRCAMVVAAAVRMLRARARSTQWGWVELCTVPEPFALLATVYLLRTGYAAPALSAGALGLALAGAGFSAVGLALTLWSIRSFPTVRTGHYVDPEHRLVTGGAYGLVRHPIYLGVYAIWLGLAMAFASLPAFLIAALYVIPVYILYMRAEEAMLAGEFGAEYEAYRERVGMVFPRPR